MEPLSVIATVAAASGAWILYDKVYKKGGDAAPGVVSKLTQGKTYTVLAVITKAITDDPRWAALGSMPNEQKIKEIISATFNQSGGKVLSNPTVRNSAEMQKALAGDPSTWVFNMQWLLTQDHVSNVIPWLAGASFVLAPTT